MAVHLSRYINKHVFFPVGFPMSRYVMGTSPTRLWIWPFHLVVSARCLDYGAFLHPNICKQVYPRDHSIDFFGIIQGDAPKKGQHWDVTHLGSKIQTCWNHDIYAMLSTFSFQAQGLGQRWHHVQPSSHPLSAPYLQLPAGNLYRFHQNHQISPIEGGFHIAMGVTPKWLVYKGKSHLFSWMI